MTDQSPAPTHDILDTQQTACCVVGGGPAGAMLALLLARQGIAASLLETRLDFERDFRGDTIHPSIMEIMHELGLAERLLQLRHAKVHQLSIHTAETQIIIGDLSRLKTRYPYITLLPQVDFLNFITAEAKRFPHFQLVMGANVQELVSEGDTIQGVRYRGQDGWHEVRATLTVGADGRFSRLRRSANLQAIKSAPPMDVLWLRLPRGPHDPTDASVSFRVGPGRFLVLVDRFDYWQLGYVFPKGGYQQLRAAGLAELQQSIAALVPWFADRVKDIEWKQVAVLSVESDRLKQWYRPGLLLIGDAAHVMSPVAGVGINYAIQDAVVAANVLSHPLKAGQVQLRDLAAVQRQREWPTRIIQAVQTRMQKQLVARALDPNIPFTLPAFLRLLPRIPILRTLPARLVGLGVWPVHVKNGSPN